MIHIVAFPAGSPALFAGLIATSMPIRFGFERAVFGVCSQAILGASQGAAARRASKGVAVSDFSGSNLPLVLLVPLVHSQSRRPNPQLIQRLAKTFTLTRTPVWPIGPLGAVAL